jgi:glycosyltransferase involved in cell wall biosynthesis
MDVLVLPSLFEGLPRVVMEASAMGVPTVASDVKGNREVVEHGRSGLLVPFGDERGLAGAIVNLVADLTSSRRMGEQARRLALERFDERAVFGRVIAEYADLLGEKGLDVPAPDQTNTAQGWSSSTDDLP